MSIYHNFTPYVTHIVVLSYVNDFLYWYTYEALVKLFVETLGSIFHVNFLGYANWLTSISISQIKDHSISVYQARYSSSILANYQDTIRFKTSKKFYKNTFPSDMIFTKYGVSTDGEQVEMLTREFNIHNISRI